MTRGANRSESTCATSAPDSAISPWNRCSSTAVAPACGDGRFTRFDELRLLTEIQAEFEMLEPQYAVAEASGTPMRAAVEPIYRRALAADVPADTYPARLA